MTQGAFLFVLVVGHTEVIQKRRCGKFGVALLVEATTSSMPWNSQKRMLLTAKAVKVGRVGKNR